MKLDDAFRELRIAWFNYQLRLHCHDREWETVEQTERRRERNQAAREWFDAQTERIIAGEDLPIAPTCMADMD